MTACERVAPISNQYRSIHDGMTPCILAKLSTAISVIFVLDIISILFLFHSQKLFLFLCYFPSAENMFQLLQGNKTILVLILVPVTENVIDRKHGLALV